MTWHALILWSPETNVDRDVRAIRQAAVELGSPRVNIDVGDERFDIDGVWARRITIHVRARSAEEARDAVRRWVGARVVEVLADE